VKLGLRRRNLLRRSWLERDRCAATALQPNATALMLENDELYPVLPPVVPPESERVITRWKVQAGPDQAPVSQKLVVFQQAGEETTREVAESALETVGPGVSEFATRIVAPEYGQIGLTRPAGALVCEKVERHQAGIVEGDWPSGETRRNEIRMDVGVPVIAVVEYDRDGDGYGDETQDRCPASAAHQGDCPTATAWVLSRVVRRGAIVVRAQVDSEAAVKVSGSVRWRASERSRASRRITDRKPPRDLMIVYLSAGAARSLVPGVTVTFRVPLPTALLKRLATLPPARKTLARLTVAATDLAGRVTERKIVVKLPGRDRRG
jgi:hypothetical protein